MSTVTNDEYAITVAFTNMKEEEQTKLVELIGLLDDTQQSIGFAWLDVPGGELGADELCNICGTHKAFKELARLTTKTTPIKKKFGEGLRDSMESREVSDDHVAVLKHIVNAYILGNLFEKQIGTKSTVEIEEYALWDKLYVAAGITKPGPSGPANPAATEALDVAGVRQQFMDITDPEKYSTLVDILDCFVTKKVQK